MSERGTYITEYIYSPTCLQVIKAHLEKTMQDPPVLLRFTEGPFGALAGLVSGLYVGEEIDVIEYEVVKPLENMLCHPIRATVIADGIKEPKVFYIKGGL